MIQLLNNFLSYYRRVLNSIAFYPSLIAFIFFTLAFASHWVEQLGATSWMIDHVPQLVINNADTARTLLSTFIGGLLSLTVFSFSMVMVILNQAASNFTPRLLPGIISSKRHQVVLGFYIGTILYCILILLTIKPDGNEYTLPGFEIFLCIFFTIVCLGLFVYFIHSISQDIQVNTILSRLMKDTTNRLESLNEQEERHRKEQSIDSDDWQEIRSDHSGYFRGIEKDTLMNVAQEEDTVFEVLPINGNYILEGVPVLKSKKSLKKEARNNALSCIKFGSKEVVRDNYIVGFKQITEIAMKAMSPGINDPGTALSAIDYLTQLFAMRMKINDSVFYLDDSEDIRISLNAIDFKELLYQTVSQLRLYSKEDPSVMRRLLEMLGKLELSPCEKEHFKEAIRKEKELVLEDAKENIKNLTDLEHLREFAN
ncbi:MAG: DUF2254 domain-containing protein [Bacteroidota bacterium]